MKDEYACRNRMNEWYLAREIKFGFRKLFFFFDVKAYPTTTFSSSSSSSPFNFIFLPLTKPDSKIQILFYVLLFFTVSVYTKVSRNEMKFWIYSLVWLNVMLKCVALQRRDRETEYEGILAAFVFIYVSVRSCVLFCCKIKTDTSLII